MKRALYIIGWAAALLLVLSGCAKDKSEPQPEVYKRTVQVVLTKGTDTKTAIVEGDDKASYVWTEGDEQYFNVWENTVKGEVSGISYSSDMKKATLTVQFATQAADEYVYTATFAKESSNSGNLKIQGTQKPELASYDPSADLMIAQSLSSPSVKNALQFTLQRIVSVNKMSLKGLSEGEKINKVEVVFDKAVSGYYITKGDNAGTYSSEGKKITLTYSEAVVPAGGTFPVYYVAIPNENASFESVSVYTDKNIYIKPSSAFSKTISFPIGYVTRFNMDMSGHGVPVSDSDIYTLVSSEADLEPGEYIIAAAELDYAMGPLAGGSTKYHSSEEITKVGNTISLDNTSPVITWTLAKSGSNWTIKNSKTDDTNFGKYLAWSSGNSSNVQQTAYNWTISISSGVAEIASAQTTNRVLQYNAGSPRFACYEGTQEDIALYKKSGEVLPLGISFAEEEYVFTLNSAEYAAFTGQVVTMEDSDSRSVTYSMVGDALGTINTSTGAITLNGTNTGTATVTATVGADATHTSGSVSYTITVNPSTGDYDLLDNEFFGVTGTNYTDKSGLVGSSGKGSMYSSNTAGNYSSIQIRSDKNNSGIVTTASGGKVTKIVVSWNSNTSSGKALQVYGKNSAYTSPSDLYSSSTQGTLIGTIVCGSSTELIVTGDYEYIGLRSSSGAMYFDEIDVYWTESAPSTDPAINITSTNPMSVGREGGSHSANYTIKNPVSGVSLTANSNVSWITNVSVGSSSISFNVAAQAEGASSRTGSIVLSYTGASSVVLTVNQEAGEGGSQAVNGWLELPAETTGSDYFSGTFWAEGKRNYTYLYQYSTYTSLWTAYPLYNSTMGNSTVSNLGPYYQSSGEVNTKGTNWAANPQIDKNKQINVWEGSYGVSVPGSNPSDIYARGHQIPNSDRSANGIMQSQTYYATNSTPQIQDRFNGYVWNKLEQAVRGSVKDTVYVVTGATFRTVGGSESITYIQPQHDTKQAPVPNYYWKVLLKVKRSGSTITSASAIGFWFVHKQYPDTDFTPYAVSVDKIEQYTGFDFFVNLPANLETSAEANTNWTTFKNF